nr:MAG TPA: hypothetical protein [Caudoviricetes sp.]
MVLLIGFFRLIQNIYILMKVEITKMKMVKLLML